MLEQEICAVPLSLVDIAFDQYRKKTIKSTAQSQRVRGKKAIRRDVHTRSQSMGALGKIHFLR
jgi:hypothetical protein